MAKTWGAEARQQRIADKAYERAARIRAQQIRVDNLRHAVEHPVAHLLGKVLGR